MKEKPVRHSIQKTLDKIKFWLMMLVFVQIGILLSSKKASFSHREEVRGLLTPFSFLKAIKFFLYHSKSSLQEPKQHFYTKPNKQGIHEKTQSTQQSY